MDILNGTINAVPHNNNRNIRVYPVTTIDARQSFLNNFFDLTCCVAWRLSDVLH